MELTGKCKEEFDKWYINNHCKDLTVPNLIKLELRLFKSMHDSMKYGVYQDYFGSVRIDIDAIYVIEEYDVYNIYQDLYNHRPEIRKNTINKANELRNEQLNGL